MKRQLINYQSEKQIILTLDGNTLITETGKASKFRTTSKVFSTPDEALSALKKKEWESLKKGFVYYNPNAQQGEAILHKFISSGYTGALAFAQAYDNFFVYGCGKTENDADILFKINQQGETLGEFPLPKNLAWEMEFQPENNQLLLNLEHHPYKFSLENETFAEHSEKIKKMSLCGNFSVKCKRNGVQVFDVKTNQLKGEIQTEYDFISIESVGFSQQHLIIKDLPMSRTLKFYDLQTLDLVEIKNLDIPEEFPSVIGFCVSPDGRYLVQRQMFDSAYVFDLKEGKFLFSFKIAHLVKSCKMQFLPAGLAVRTDYGCFSVYAF